MVLSNLKEMQSQVTNNERCWIAATTRFNQELALKTLFTERSIDHFIPSRTVIRKSGGVVREIEQPVIPNLIFLHTTWKEAFDLLARYPNKFTYIRGGDHRILEIPSLQMDQFIRLVTQDQNKVTIRSEAFFVGDRVVIKEGELAGIEGILVEIDNKKEFVLQINGLLAASIRIPQTNLIKIKTRL